MTVALCLGDWRSPVGSRHGSARLDEERVRAIKDRIAQGERATDLAAEFGVSRPTISDIKTGRTWAHLDGPVLDEGNRLWLGIEVGAGDCWVWTGLTNPKGYGSIRVAWKLWVAHRLAWTLTYGPIPDGLAVLHHCDNPPCCNPDHLWLGTRAENNRDMAAKGRARNPVADRNRQLTHCLRGHPFDEANTYRPPGGKPQRHCRACQRERERQRRR